MKGIARFFTLYWIIYFPTCIAYNDLPGFSSIDEAMTILLFLYTITKFGSRYTNRKPWKEFLVCIRMMLFYVGDSVLFGAKVAEGVWVLWMR